MAEGNFGCRESLEQAADKCSVGVVGSSVDRVVGSFAGSSVVADN